MVVRRSGVRDGSAMAVVHPQSPVLDRVRRLFDGPARPLPTWRRTASWVGPVATIVAVIILGFLASHGVSIPDPTPILVITVVAGALVGGLRPGLVAAAIALADCLFFFMGQPYASQPGNALRVILLAGFIPTVATLVGAARDRFIVDRTELIQRRTFDRDLDAYANALVRDPIESLFSAIVDRIPTLIPGDLVALTLADPRDSRHFVRAVHGADASLVGVEIVPGVGVAGAAIVTRDVVVAERLQPNAGTAPDAAPGSTVLGAPVIIDGRVIATITVGRTTNVHPFTPAEREQMARLAGATALVLKNVELRTELAESALRDPLTGLYNRSYLDAALDQLLALRRRMKPDDRAALAVIMFDVDGFRRFNEEHGRATGDRVLQAVGTILRQRFRTSDTMARIGGDGFIVVLEGADRVIAARAASDVRDMVRKLTLTTARGEPVKVTVSAGATSFDDADPGAQAVIRTVEAALDTARFSGRDTIVSV